MSVLLSRLNKSDLGVLRIKERRKAEAKSGEDVDMSDVMEGLHRKARDHSRVPMPVCAISP